MPRQIGEMSNRLGASRAASRPKSTCEDGANFAAPSAAAQRRLTTAARRSARRADPRPPAPIPSARRALKARRTEESASLDVHPPPLIA
jgi:hypothetical protein